MKTSILFLIKTCIVFLVLWFLITSSQLKLNLLTTFFQHPGMAGIIILLFFAMVLTCAWRWWHLNRVQDISVPFQKTIMPTYLGVALNSLLPGSDGGDFARLFYLFKKFPEQKSSVALSILFDRLTGLMGIFLVVLVVALFHLSQDKTMFYFSLSCIAVCLSGLSLFFAALLLPEPVRMRAWLVKRFFDKNWLQVLLSVLNAIHIYRKSLWVIIQCLLASVVIQVFIAITMLIINHMMGLPPVSLLRLAIAAAIAQIANLLPLTPGGLGVGEVAFANVLLFLNPLINAPYATVFLSFRLISLVSYLPAVLFYVVNFRRNASPWRGKAFLR